VFKKPNASSAPFTAAGFRRLKMARATTNAFSNTWRRSCWWWWWRRRRRWWWLCVVGSLHFDTLKHTPLAPKGKRFGRHACIGRVAQGQRGGCVCVLGVFENWAGKRPNATLVATISSDTQTGIVGHRKMTLLYVHMPLPKAVAHWDLALKYSQSSPEPYAAGASGSRGYHIGGRSRFSR